MKKSLSIVHLIYLITVLSKRPVLAQVHNCATVSVVVGSISTRGNNNIYLYFHFSTLVTWQSAALRSAAQHIMPTEFGGKWGMECLNTRYRLIRQREETQSAGYSMKLIKKGMYKESGQDNIL